MHVIFFKKMFIKFESTKHANLSVGSADLNLDFHYHNCTQIHYNVWIKFAPDIQLQKGVSVLSYDNIDEYRWGD